MPRVAPWALALLVIAVRVHAQGIVVTPASPAALGLDTLLLRQASEAAEL